MLLLLAGGEIASPTYSSNYVFVLIAVAFGYDYDFVIKIDFVFRYTRYLCYRVIDGANASRCSGHAFNAEGNLIQVKFGTASFISGSFRFGNRNVGRTLIAANKGNCK
jgi:hypothetical protein